MRPLPAHVAEWPRIVCKLGMHPACFLCSSRAVRPKYVCVNRCAAAAHSGCTQPSRARHGPILACNLGQTLLLMLATSSRPEQAGSGASRQLCRLIYEHRHLPAEHVIYWFDASWRFRPF